MASSSTSLSAIICRQCGKYHPHRMHRSRIAYHVRTRPTCTTWCAPVSAIRAEQGRAGPGFRV
jgi:hypothetical protein